MTFGQTNQNLTQCVSRILLQTDHHYRKAGTGATRGRTESATKATKHDYRQKHYYKEWLWQKKKTKLYSYKPKPCCSNMFWTWFITVEETDREAAGKLLTVVFSPQLIILHFTQSPKRANAFPSNQTELFIWLISGTASDTSTVFI